MPIRLGEIAVKRAEYATVIAALARNTRVVRRVGGSDAVAWTDEIIFQTLRLVLLDWATTASEAAVRDLAARHAATLPPEALAAKYGETTGLSTALVSRLGYIELCELCLGEHPSQRGRPLVDDVATAEEIAALLARVPPALPVSDPDASLKDVADQPVDPLVV